MFGWGEMRMLENTSARFFPVTMPIQVARYWHNMAVQLKNRTSDTRSNPKRAPPSTAATHLPKSIYPIETISAGPKDGKRWGTTPPNTSVAMPSANQVMYINYSNSGRVSIGLPIYFCIPLPHLCVDIIYQLHLWEIDLDIGDPPTRLDPQSQPWTMFKYEQKIMPKKQISQTLVLPW